MSVKKKLLMTLFNLVLIFASGYLFTTVLPAGTSGAADITLPPGGTATQPPETAAIGKESQSGDAYSAFSNDMDRNGMEPVLDSRGSVIGWKRRNSTDAPVMLPSRNIKEEKGETVIEIEDPDSMLLDQKLYEVERLPEIRAVDKGAIELAQAYAAADSAPRPFMKASNGRINFYYGTMNPRIICRPLRLTDIELESGEQVASVHISDSERWSVSGAASGELENLVTHVIIKPQLPDIAANLLIHTNRRTYSIELISLTSEQYMPFVGFIYPATPETTSAEDKRSWDELMKQYSHANEAKESKEKAQGNARLADPVTIDTDYVIKTTKGKNIPWKPKVAYAANGKTYVVMPDKMKITEAPVFFIKQNGREKLTNYRVEGNVYVIDRIFNLGIMTIAGERVAIYKKHPIGAPEKDVPIPAATDTEKKPSPQPTPAVKSKTTDVDATADDGINITLTHGEEFTTPETETTPDVEEKSDGEPSKKPEQKDYDAKWRVLLEKYGPSTSGVADNGTK
jgi:type IV secretion system protein VirB9